MKIILLMCAGALGTLARYGFSVWIQEWVSDWGGRTFLGASFPLSTLLVNVLGSFLLAVIVTLVTIHVVKPEWRIIIGTGFLGAFTTFSTFELEAQHLLQWQEWKAASVYIAGNVVLGFGAILFGRALVMRLFAG